MDSGRRSVAPTRARRGRTAYHLIAVRHVVFQQGVGEEHRWVIFGYCGKVVRGRVPKAWFDLGDSGLNAEAKPLNQSLRITMSPFPGMEWG